ncbi:IclR family transcriptional regulator [Marinobacterium aestuariivivens]|uniref:IclR family transcriptional regulator n=1 Tax=Marinobacterium aestuariivivens TaxID=1698799 RepID=A0ABW1ZXF5_9GAMM
METDDRYIVPGLVRGLAVLQQFSRNRRELSISELAEAIEVNRSSTFRLVHTLEHCGFLRRIADTNRYTLSSRVLDLGFQFLSSLDLLEPSRPILEALRNRTTLACQLMVREGRDVVIVDCFQATGPFTSTVSVGTRWPAHATAVGQLMLSSLPEEKLREIYRDFSFQRFTEQTPTNIDSLLERVKSFRNQPAATAWGTSTPAWRPVPHRSTAWTTIASSQPCRSVAHWAA